MVRRLADPHEFDALIGAIVHNCQRKAFFEAEGSIIKPLIYCGLIAIYPAVAMCWLTKQVVDLPDDLGTNRLLMSICWPIATVLWSGLFFGLVYRSYLKKHFAVHQHGLRWSDRAIHFAEIASVQPGARPWRLQEWMPTLWKAFLFFQSEVRHALTERQRTSLLLELKGEGSFELSFVMKYFSGDDVRVLISSPRLSHPEWFTESHCGR